MLHTIVPMRIKKKLHFLTLNFENYKETSTIYMSRSLVARYIQVCPDSTYQTIGQACISVTIKSDQNSS